MENFLKCRSMGPEVFRSRFVFVSLLVGLMALFDIIRNRDKVQSTKDFALRIDLQLRIVRFLVDCVFLESLWAIEYFSFFKMASLGVYGSDFGLVS